MGKSVLSLSRQRQQCGVRRGGEIGEEVGGVAQEGHYRYRLLVIGGEGGGEGGEEVRQRLARSHRGAAFEGRE